MDQETRRIRMVAEQIVARGVRDPLVLAAMRKVPRELFVPAALADFAYEDCALPIEEGQTISQPYVVAWMTAALELQPGDRALEIGTGSGYAAAVLAEIAREVRTVERHRPLAEGARRRLADAGYANVFVRCGDGTLGWAEHAPYDGIVVTAGGPVIPEALLAQLATGGRLVMPVGEEPELQHLVRVRRAAERELRIEELGDVQFVPLVGEQGWQPEDPAHQGFRT